MTKAYPTIFAKTDDCYLIEVPDLEILTEGADMENAVFMAKDAISLMLVYLEENNETIPKPSDVGCIDVSAGTFAEYGKSFVSIVDVADKP